MDSRLREYLPRPPVQQPHFSSRSLGGTEGAPEHTHCPRVMGLHPAMGIQLCVPHFSYTSHVFLNYSFLVALNNLSRSLCHSQIFIRLALFKFWDFPSLCQGQVTLYRESPHSSVDHCTFLRPFPLPPRLLRPPARLLRPHARLLRPPGPSSPASPVTTKQLHQTAGVTCS